MYKSESFKSKISQANVGVNNSMYGKSHLESTRILMSANRKGKLVAESNPNYGGLSEKHKIAIGKSKRGTKLSKETKKNMSKVRKGTRLGPDNPAWKGGTSFEPYCEVWKNIEFKEDIKRRDNYKCLNPYCRGDGSSKLVLHHIDYNKKNCTPNNLITICNSCNSMANKDRDWHSFWYNAIIFNRYGAIK